MSDTSTHRPDQGVIDEQTRQAGGTAQWLLENRHTAGTHPITQRNVLEPLVCGEEAFRQIAKDIEAAVDSIDLVCWGFDPGMELERTGNSWPRGQPYGSLLDAAAGRGVKVRLLVWHEAGAASMKMNNMPGLSGDQREGYLVRSPTTTREKLEALGIDVPPPSLGGPDRRTPEQLRNDYCVEWWRNVKAPPKGGDKSTRIEFKTRRGAKSDKVRTSLQDEADKPSSKAGDYGGLVNEKSLIEDHATHHQKTILIDYAWQDGEKAVGYVMGLNSVTDYWDTAEHIFDTPLREPDWARKTETAKALPVSYQISRDPYRDYVCRIVGPVLQGVHKNFAEGWKRAGGKARADDADMLPAKLVPQQCTPYGAQIVRTCPDDGDKTIKETYFHAPQFARNYIYIENQYFFYESWVRNLKETRQKFMKGGQGAGSDPKESPLLHLFVVIPWPEDKGMVPRTYDTVKSLGEGSSMAAQHQAMVDKEAAVNDSMAYDKELERIQMQELAAGHDPTQAMRALHKPENYVNTRKADPIYDSAAVVSVPTKNHKTGELKGLGLKVLMARLTTYNRGKPLPVPGLNYRQVYIHSKLMLIDDAFFTLGSANLNQRSMAADSEINIATDDHVQAEALRRKVWGQLGKGYESSDGGCGDKTAIVAAFDDWKDVMQLNKDKLPAGGELKGHLVPFEDDRKIDFRHG